MPAADWLRGQRDEKLTNFRFDPALPDRSLDEVLETAQREWRDPDDEWQPHVCALAARGNAETLATHEPSSAHAEDPELRELAAYVLGQLGTTDSRAARRAGGRRCGRWPSARTTRTCCRRSSAPSATSARPPARTGCSPSAPTPDTYVREAVAFALGGRPGEETLQALIELSADADAKVRDWATFALGTLAETDSPALRDALAARLDDPDEDTRMEAVHGLALRGDERAQAPARDLLEGRDTTDDGVWRRHLLAETAENLDGLKTSGAPEGARSAKCRWVPVLTRRGAAGSAAGVATAASAGAGAGPRSRSRSGGRLDRGGSGPERPRRPRPAPERRAEPRPRGPAREPEPGPEPRRGGLRGDRRRFGRRRRAAPRASGRSGSGCSTVGVLDRRRGRVVLDRGLLDRRRDRRRLVVDRRVVDRRGRDGQAVRVAVAVAIVHAVGQAVAVGVRVQRVAAVGLFDRVGDAVAVGVVVAVDATVAVGVLGLRAVRDAERGRRLRCRSRSWSSWRR